MQFLLLEYPPCSTCRNAKKWLEENKIPYKDRHIVQERPSAAELKEWHQRSGLPLKNLFNANGLAYKALHLKNQLPGMDKEEQINLLASDGKLVKRPLLVCDEYVLVGFNPDEWGKKLKNK